MTKGNLTLGSEHTMQHQSHFKTVNMLTVGQGISKNLDNLGNACF